MRTQRKRVLAAGKRKRVLAIDGGGIRGLIPALVLAEMERRTGKPIAQLFDLISGTSTGGILALGLAKPGYDGKPELPASRLAELYLYEGPVIFPRRPFARVKRPFSEKYSSDGLEGVLRKYFGDTQLSDAVTELLIPSYEIEQRQPWFFRSRHARQDSAYDFPFCEVGLAASAAPTYFEPRRVRSAAGQDWHLIDGGVYANNPALCGYVESRSLYPEADVLLVSIGTGRHAVPLRYQDACGWGLLGWARPVLDVVFDGVSRTTEFQLSQLLPSLESGKQYFRFQADLADGHSAMDDHSIKTLNHLRRLAEKMISEHDSDLEDLCRHLMA